MKIKVTKAKDEYAYSLENSINQVMISLEKGEEVDYSKINDTFDYMNRRYDTSDFKLPSIIRILYDHEYKLPVDVRKNMKETILNFKFWMDQNGDDSMCYWSENHQILFAAGEYLLGNFYKDEIFTNMNFKGEKHSELGRKRVEIWLEQVFLYGFSEWCSSTYYLEDLAALSVLVDFAPHKEISTRASIILDLLFYDIATGNLKGTFASVSGRMYAQTKMCGSKSSMKRAIALVWNDYKDNLTDAEITGIEGNFLYIKKYKVPKVIVDIGYDQNETNIYKTSVGLNLNEYKNENLNGTDENQIMFQFKSEAFSNYQVINNTMEYVKANNLLSNEFLNELKVIDYSFLRKFKLTSLVSYIINSKYNGTVLQRANTYTYRTDKYLMATTQAYHPGYYADQHSLFSLTINNNFNIFLQHPAKSYKEDGALALSPNYWVGNGYNPHTVGEKNFNISIFSMPKDATDFTHAFFPKQFMDEVLIEENYAFAKIDKVFVAIIGKNNFEYMPFEEDKLTLELGITANYDLIQKGRESYWIVDVGTSEEYIRFSNFVKHIKKQKIEYKNKAVKYKDLQLKYKGEFTFKGEVIDTDYKRFDSKYVTASRKDKIIKFSKDNCFLTLDFYNSVRIEKNI